MKFTVGTKVVLKDNPNTVYTIRETYAKGIDLTYVTEYGRTVSAGWWDYSLFKEYKAKDS